MMKSKTKIDIRLLCLIPMFTALTAVSAQLPIPAPIVPITLQTLFVMLSGLILGARDGMISQIIYALLGLIGVPVFSGLQGGIGTIARPGFGFVLGFIACAFVTGYLSRKLRRGGLIISCVAGLAVLYIVGVPYMYFILKYVMSSGITLWGAIKSGVLVFLPGEVLKTAVAVVVSSAVMHRMQRIK